MMVTSTRRYVRQPARKVRLVAAMVRTLHDPDRVLEILKFSNKRAAVPIVKTIQTALADATNTYKLDRGKLLIRSITVMDGPILKRWRPVARGIAHPVKKRTSHIRVMVEG